MLCVTTAKVCVYKTITGYLPFVLHCSFYVRLMLHGWKYPHAIKLEYMPRAALVHFLSQNIIQQKSKSLQTKLLACVFKQVNNMVVKSLLSQHAQ